MRDLMGSPTAARPRGFFASRWHGDVPLRRLFWWDMVTIGTLANALTSLVALMLLARGVGGTAWAAVHFSIVPYNVFLLLAVWRAGGASWAIRSAAFVWFLCALYV